MRELHPLDTGERYGIAILTPARTLLDLAPRLSADQLSRACHEAWHRHRTTPADIEACIARNPHKNGIAKLRHALGSDVVLSPLEARFRRLMREHDLPLPRTNVDVHGDKVDCHWPEHGLTVELHSYRFHATRGGVRERPRPAPAIQPRRVWLGRRLRPRPPDGRRGSKAPRAGETGTG